MLIDIAEKLLGDAGQARVSSLVPSRTDAVLLYHSVGEPDEFGNVSIGRFERDLRMLTANYDLVDLSEVRHPTDGAPPKAAITFDDGFANFYEHALPLLQEYGVPATVFVVADTLTDQPTTLEADRTMSEAQLGELVDDKRITVGNHTRTHRRLSAVDSDEDLREEIVGAKELLESRLGTTIDLFAYPYGAFDERAVELVGKSHSAAFTTVPEPWTRESDRYRIPRISAHNLQRRLKWLACDLGLKLRRPFRQTFNHCSIFLTYQ